MNAVNLIPLERRRAEVPALPGTPFLGLLAALVLALVGTVAYVGERAHVATRQNELTHLQAATAQWSAAAARYAPAVAAVHHRAKGFAQLGDLLGERYEWSVLLDQLAGVMPAHAQLTSLSAATPASSGTATAGASTASAGTSASSGITASGCAASQAVVADTMVALRRLSGVSAVSLTSSSRQGTSSGGTGSAGSGGSGDCGLPVQFSLTLQFTPSTGSVQMPTVANTGGAAQAQASTTAQSPSSSDTTGAAQ